MTQKHPATFKLFKSTSPNASSPYVGSVQLDGKWYAIEAWVVDNVPGPGKHFEGGVAGGRALARQMVRSAKEAPPDDLLKALSDAPFDDVQALRQALPDGAGEAIGSNGSSGSMACVRGTQGCLYGQAVHAICMVVAQTTTQVSA